MYCKVHIEEEVIHLHTVHLSSFRNLNRDLQERSERFTTKVKSLTAEIVEVKLHLEQAKARNMAGKGIKGMSM